MAATISPGKYDVPQSVSPLREDSPGTITAMPSPFKIHHIHIDTNERFDEMVAFYQTLFNAEAVRLTAGRSAFLSFDDSDHKVAIFKRAGLGPRDEKSVGVSHNAFCYASLGELLFVYKKMTASGDQWFHRAVNHGNSTSINYRDPDGNEVETMIDNYTPLETKDYKRYYQGTKEFGSMNEGTFDPDKMVALYESGVPDTVLLDRDEVKRLINEGKL